MVGAGDGDVHGAADFDGAAAVEDTVGDPGATGKGACCGAAPLGTYIYIYIHTCTYIYTHRHSLPLCQIQIRHINDYGWFVNVTFV